MIAFMFCGTALALALWRLGAAALAEGAAFVVAGSRTEAVPSEAAPIAAGPPSAYRGGVAARGGYYRGGRWYPGVAGGAAAVGAAAAAGSYYYNNAQCGYYPYPPCQ
jgi:hypothetical protein